MRLPDNLYFRRSRFVLFGFEDSKPRIKARVCEGLGVSASVPFDRYFFLSFWLLMKKT